VATGFEPVNNGVAVLVPGRHLINPLPDQLHQGMPNVSRRAEIF